MRRAMLLKVLAFMSMLFSSALKSMPASSVEGTAGSYLVGTVQGAYVNKWGTYLATIYYPALRSGTDVPPNRTRAPYPGVVFAHGFLANKDEHKSIGNQLASWGYVALLLSTPNARSGHLDQWSEGISSGITYLTELSSSDSSLLTGMVDSAKLGAMGHSMGGAGAILATANDPRIKSMVALAPAPPSRGSPVFAKALEAARTLKVPVQIQVGSKDGLTPNDSVHEYYVNLPGLAAKEYVEIEGGGHINFTDIESRLPSIVDPGSTLGLGRQHEISWPFFTAWFQYFLQGDMSYETDLFGARAQNALKSNALSALEWVKP